VIVNGHWIYGQIVYKQKVLNQMTGLFQIQKKFTTNSNIDTRWSLYELLKCSGSKFYNYFNVNFIFTTN